MRVRHGTDHRPTRDQCSAKDPVPSTSPTCPARHLRWVENSPPFRGETETLLRRQNRHGSQINRQRRLPGENRQLSDQSLLGQSQRGKRQRVGRGKQLALLLRGHLHAQRAEQQRPSDSVSKSLFTKAPFRLSKRHQRPANVPRLILTTICGSSSNEHLQRSRPRKQRKMQMNAQCELTDVTNTHCAKTNHRDIRVFARLGSRVMGTFARM